MDEIVEWAWRHRGEDPLKMLLKGDLPSGVDAQRVAEQMEGQAMAASKWPWLASYDSIAYPCRLSREQSSSETAARYKAELVSKRLMPDSKYTLADLTGGMGIDSLMFAYDAKHVDYVEQDGTLCDIMAHNAQALALDNITCHNSDCLTWLEADERHFDVIYIDPARRGERGQKLVSLADCQPNVIEMLPMLRKRCERLLIKTSPMIDIHESLRQLGDVAEVHILAVNHECKEVLFIVGGGQQAAGSGQVKVRCVDVWNGGEWRNEFVLGDEVVPSYAAEVRRYLYEPNATLMKGAPWGEICQWYGVEKLDRNSHLYTSDQLVADFPGRLFEVLKEVRLSKKSLQREVNQANIVVRNYPVDANTLRRQLSIADGGDQYLIATTVKGEKKGLLCSRVASFRK
ncbi:MAG: hypothetical protein II975_05200 [Bacteroidales bacterium]|nr:hypothetical protein [Bacteroidales bacterium]